MPIFEIYIEDELLLSEEFSVDFEAGEILEEFSTVKRDEHYKWIPVFFMI